MGKKIKINLEIIHLDKFRSTECAEALTTVPADTKQLEKKAKYYEHIDYPIKLQTDSDDHGTYWVAELPDLPGCMTHGHTKEEALANVDDAKNSWIYSALSLEVPIPEPRTKSEIEDCSGRILLRVPKELHYRLLQKAKEDKTSLNQEILFLISTALGANSASRV